MSKTTSQSLRPSPAQLTWQRAHQFAVFCHFGINTFNDREWSDGTLPAESFNPAALDADQWVSAAKEAGAAHLILTAKHHDGFCLWPTATTDYSVASSPWRDGTGDVVADVAAACRRHDLGFGLYLSPWDRHQLSWANDHAVYDRLYLNQLTELCSDYGDLCEVWFDGAGSEYHPYDWNSIMTVVETLQPEALVFNMGRPTIRWVGNEDGLAGDPCWYVVDATHKSMFDAGTDILDEARYLPPECDVAIRRHWFWHADDEDSLKSLQHLEAIWYRSIGLGANLLLNVPPDTRGLLDEADRTRLIELGRTMQERFRRPMVAAIAQQGSVVTATFTQEVTIDHLWLEEAIEDGQRIRQHHVMLPDGTAVTGGFTVGSQRVHVFPAVTTAELVIDLGDKDGRLTSVHGFRTG
ncbi:MAG TPA: alpha-L-fucosidase, partial [Thermomicrobiales bacterium]|nr:alpha-L-fucosidase [Thermomicrobiales bacterium]